jgi:hypothetical protein
MRRWRALCTAPIAFGLMTSLLFGHHSVLVGFDDTKVKTVQGVITRVEWLNPHVRLFMDVKSPTGSITNWNIEIASPNALSRLAIKGNTFEVGKSYSVEVWPARDGSSVANGRKITFDDGRAFDIGDNFGAVIPAK